jgi:hypothetical protein
MKKICILLLFIPAISYGQEFRPLHMLPDSSMTKNIVGRRTSYTYEVYTFEGTGKILKVRENKKMIFADEAKEDVKITVPHIFVSDSVSDSPVLVTELTSEVLYGFNIYILKGLESVKIGFIPVAGFPEGADAESVNIVPVSIADKLVLQTDGTMMRISFSADKILLRPGSGKEEVVNGDQIKFLFNGKKLKEVDEF